MRNAGATRSGEFAIGRGDATGGRIGSRAMEFLLFCLVVVMFAFTAGAYYSSRG